MPILPPARPAVIAAVVGSALLSGSLAFAQPYAYVLGQRDDPATPENLGVQVITVIDTATNSKVTSVDAGLGCQCVAPNSIAISRDGSEVYVANEIGNSVTVMSTVTNTVVGAMGLAVVVSNPNALVVSPDNTRLYVLGGGPGSPVVVVDRASRTRVTSISLGVGQARGVAVSPDGSRLYASTYGSNSVKVVNTATNTVLTTVPVVNLPLGVAVSPDGQFVYTAALSANAVSVVRTSSNTLVTSIPVGLSPFDVGVAPDGTRTYAVNGNSGTLSIIDPVTNTVMGTVTGVLNGRSIEFTADSERAYVAGNGAVYAVDTASNAVIGTIPLVAATEGSGAASTVTPPPFVPPPNPAPTGLYVSSVVGNLVTLRWTPPVGSAPTQYLVEGGVSPGEVLASLPTGGTAPLFSFTVPTGAFHVRLHADTSMGRSPASNEVRLFVNTPAPPSAPTGLLGLVNGSDLALSWTNTFAGGAPSSSVLDVTGDFTGSLPLGPGESFSFAGVPPGTYTMAVRSLNASGSSAASETVTLVFPGACSGAPQGPANFLATKAGSTITVIWDPPAAGPAPTAYVLRVTGAFAGQLPTAGRSLSGAVGPGTYQLSVRATNPCGESVDTAVQTVAIP